MRRRPAFLIRNATVAVVLLAASSHSAFATSAEPAGHPQVDPEPCVAAAAADDVDKTIAVCGALVENAKTAKSDRVTALIARAGAYVRKEMPDSAIGDYDVALLLDPSQADIFNTRGELWRKKGDRRRALADFAAAIKLSPDHPTAKTSYKSLAQELERAGAQMAVAGKPSFNCATSKRQVEKAICANPELADLDREINATFLKVIARPEYDSHRASTALLREQRNFIDKRNASFGRPAYDLRKAMKERLDKLNSIVRQ
ncbi:MAG TPA: lysozyme inhibitor LprI family protein [Bradyrhizobium sp.]|jgi:tetratricopeptide (TPR) repeat protein|nr:lysozyme inhibitor LprI family protein [Bradyrhizobium sp.]